MTWNVTSGSFANAGGRQFANKASAADINGCLCMM